MKAIFSLILILTFSSTTFAQETGTVDQLIKVLSYGVGNQTRETELTIEQLKAREGQCFPAQFAKCNILLSNNSTIDDVSAKYDFKENVILISHKGKTVIAAPNMIRKMNCASNDRKYKLLNVSELGRTFGKKGFYEVMLEDKGNMLVCYRRIAALPPSHNATLDIGIRDTTYAERREFLVYKNQKAYALESFKSKTLSQFDQHSNALKAYIKKEKLKFKNEEDLKKFSQYLWTL